MLRGLHPPRYGIQCLMPCALAGMAWLPGAAAQHLAQMPVPQLMGVTRELTVLRAEAEVLRRQVADLTAKLQQASGSQLMSANECRAPCPRGQGEPGAM